MPLRRRTFPIALVFLSALLAPVLLAGAGIVPTDLLRIRQITSVDISQDGSAAVFAVKSIHTEPPAKKGDDPTYEYRSHLYLADLDATGAPRQLTFGKTNDTNPVFSPDGRHVAFLRPDGRRPQLWIMPVGAPGEPRKLTELPHGAANPVWRPDGKAVLISSPMPVSAIPGRPSFPMERPKRDWFDSEVRGGDKPVEGADPDGDISAIRRWLDRNGARDNPFVINRLAFQDELGLRKELQLSQLYVVALEEPEAMAKPLAHAFRSYTAYDWSPDGKRIVAAAEAPLTPDIHPDRRGSLVGIRSALWTIDAAGTAGTKAEALLDDPDLSLGAPRFFPDGSLLITARANKEPTFAQTTLRRFRPPSRRLETVAAEWTASIQEAQPLPDGSVLFSSNWHGGVPLMHWTPGRALSPQVAPGRPEGVGVFAQAGKRIVYSLIRPSNPNELWLLDANGQRRRLTDLHESWLGGKQLSKPEERWITRPDGFKVQYWTMAPQGVQTGQRYPTVLDMHGGPHAMWGPGEFTMWYEFQLLCAFGYGVVYSNPRGSSGYGYEFQKANYRDWGKGPAGDVLAALDDAAQRHAWLDRQRLFIAGGSYAGYLTAWVIGHDQRFRAAVAQRGVFDLVTAYGESNAFQLFRNDMGGLPWDAEARAVYERESPQTYVTQIRTPLLILHGSQDERVGVSQSQMLYRALKELNREVEYVRYPGAGHELTRSGEPRQRMDHMLRMIEFFTRYANPR